MSDRETSSLREWIASLPANDPRFEAMLTYLRGVRVTGRGSPVPRMLGEWALLGFLLQTGQMALGSGEAPDMRARNLAGDIEAQLQLAAQAASLDFD
ncbi:hypothetical protein EKD04_009710 [Chloroflexales bacterium ZM16-3]|nr:hypothetical protein [Chloroflexales bacterium ZM16-3]